MASRQVRGGHPDCNVAAQPSGTPTMVKRSVRSTRVGRFDAFGLAARGESLGGEIDVTRQARIADRLAPKSGAVPIAWKIAGGRDGVARPTLTVTIEGSLPLVCQRCLQRFELPIAQRTELLLARTEAELEPLDAGDAEVLLAAAPLDVLTLVEDELLLSLPFAPRHGEGQCAASLEPAAEPASHTAPSKTSPFARLSALKKGTEGSFKE